MGGGLARRHSARDDPGADLRPRQRHRGGDRHGDGALRPAGDRHRAPCSRNLSHPARPRARRTAGFRLRHRFPIGIRIVKRIVIDVGGTNTDAVLVSEGRVEAAVKVPTTADVTAGILAAMRMLRGQTGDAHQVGAVMIGTTHFTNAVVQHRDLAVVAAVRIGAPATTALPPFCDWPEELARLVAGGTWIVEGGHDYDGRRFMPLNLDQVRRAAREIRTREIREVAVTAMFSPLDPSHEDMVAEILREEIPRVSVTCSHWLGGIGLVPLARRTVDAFARAMAESGLDAPLYITQNDGTVAAASYAAALPVFGFASGPTNSMRGGAYLSKLEDAIVADVGGTTTDFGHLQAGFPRQANSIVQVGGVLTLFRMPDLVS